MKFYRLSDATFYDHIYLYNFSWIKKYLVSVISKGDFSDLLFAFLCTNPLLQRAVLKTSGLMWKPLSLNILFAIQRILSKPSGIKNTRQITYIAIE